MGGIKSDKTLRFLIEMLGLDSSDYVRLQIMRTFRDLELTDIRVLRALREREKGGGVLGFEASKILAANDYQATTVYSNTPATTLRRTNKTSMSHANSFFMTSSRGRTNTGYSKRSPQTRDTHRTRTTGTTTGRTTSPDTVSSMR